MAQAHRAADENGLDLSPATFENLMVLGILRPSSSLSERWAPGADDGTNATPVHDVKIGSQEGPR